MKTLVIEYNPKYINPNEHHTVLKYNEYSALLVLPVDDALVSGVLNIKTSTIFDIDIVGDDNVTNQLLNRLSTLKLSDLIVAPNFKVDEFIIKVQLVDVPFKVVNFCNVHGKCTYCHTDGSKYYYMTKSGSLFMTSNVELTVDTVNQIRTKDPRSGSSCVTSIYQYKLSQAGLDLSILEGDDPSNFNVYENEMALGRTSCPYVYVIRMDDNYFQIPIDTVHGATYDGELQIGERLFQGLSVDKTEFLDFIYTGKVRS
tara:strand:- start:122668 stop:123438 length:771 start_codon:yes stop_codon:yes gene_type:complete